MEIQTVSNIVSLTLAAVFASLAAIRVLRLALPRRFHTSPGRARWAGFAGGVLRALAALFLVLPQTRIWGGLLAASVAFFMVVEQLESQNYSRALPGVLVMIAIPLALASGPLS
jgi:hypothetical protein